MSNAADVDLVIRRANPGDAGTVGDLIDAMDAHYNGRGNTAGSIGAEQIARHAMETGEGTRFALAFKGVEPLGLACYAVIRPGHRHQGLIFLKDLFVRVEYRGHGVGRALLAWLAAEALKAGIGRIDLTADKENVGACRLYESMDGEAREILMYRWTGSALTRLAASRRQGF